MGETRKLAAILVTDVVGTEAPQARQGAIRVGCRMSLARARCVLTESGFPNQG